MDILSIILWFSAAMAEICCLAMYIRKKNMAIWAMFGAVGCMIVMVIMTPAALCSILSLLWDMQ